MSARRAGSFEVSGVGIGIFNLQHKRTEDFYIAIAFVIDLAGLDDGKIEPSCLAAPPYSPPFFCAKASPNA